MATVAAIVAVVAVVAAVTVGAVGGEDLRNVIITGFGELPYEPAPGWQAGGFFQSDVFPADVNGPDGLPLTMDVALRTRILVEDPNEKKSTSDATESNSAEDGVKASTTNSQVSQKNTLDQEKAKEIEEELLSARTRSGLKKLNDLRDTKEKSKSSSPAPKSSVTISQFHQAKQSNPPYPSDSNGYNNREYYGDLGEGWSLQDAEEVLGGRNFNVLTPDNGYYPPPPPPPREMPPPPRFNPSPFYPFPSFGYKPFPPPPSFAHPATGRSGRSGYYREDTPRSPPRLREEVVYGRSTDLVRQPSQTYTLRRRAPARRVFHYDDYLSGA